MKNRIGDKLVNLKKKNEVAILFSHDCQEALNYMPFIGIGSDWQESVARTWPLAGEWRLLRRSKVLLPEPEGNAN